MRETLRKIFPYAWVILCFFIIAHGIVYMVRAGIGVSPWDVLHLGIATKTGISMGRVIQATGLVIVLISWLFHVKPSIVTLMNMFFIGQFVDLVNHLGYIPQPEVTWLKYASYMLGVAICGVGIGFYISANCGAGPRDTLMMVLTKATSIRIGFIRILIEVTVATAGFLLGGPLGAGTVLFALSIGFFVELGFRVVNLIKRSRLFGRIWAGSAVAKPFAER